MTRTSTTPVNLVNVRGTELLASDTREQYRRKLARITLDSMVQFVGLLDAKGTVLEINQVALDAVGIKLSDVEGKPFWTTFWWQVSAEINATLKESIRRASQGEFVRWDAEIYGRAGGTETIIIDASLMPVKDERGNVVFITAEGRDITEKKAHEREIARQREELAQLDKLKTQFFANISHEFRTPLTLMMGPLQDALARPEELSDANRDRLELAHRNSLRLLKLVNTLLDFSRIEAGRIDASYAPTDLAILTAELASGFRSAIERAGMRLIVDCPPLSETVYVDREMWEKIVLNILSNAFKFTFEGEIELSLRQIDAAVQLTIRDTGTGIPADEIPRLFERFHRVKGARGRSYEGSGIGLALVQELVKLHGGTVTVESELERGSAFTVTIPLGKTHLPAGRVEAARTMSSTGLRSEAFLEEALRWLPDEQRPAPAQPAEKNSDDTFEELRGNRVGLEPDGRPAKQRILIADDNADMREYVTRLLGDRFHVQGVADGQAALEAARANRPDLVLSDIMMPSLDGFGLLLELRADPRLRDIPIILISARAGEESRIEGLIAGADDYLIKPFSARELVARVGSQLALARQRRAAEQAIRFRGEQFETLLNQAPIGVYLVDADFRIREINPVALRAFGDIPGGVVGRDFDEIIHVLWEKQYADELVRIFRRTLETGEPCIMPERAELRLDRGVTEYYEWRLGRTPLPDGCYGLVCYFRDISAQVSARKAIEKSREALKDADRRKDEFLATLAHELRNPLAPIRNAVALLKQPHLSPENFQLAREITEHQVDHMVRLIDDLLDVSRISQGKIQLKRERVTLQSIVDQALETCRPHIQENGHQLRVELPSEIIYLNADSVRLAQVLSNLINNACKYSEKNGNIEIRAQIESQDTAARPSQTPEQSLVESATGQRKSEIPQVVVSVKDTGIGIAPEHLPRLFQMFSQVSSALKLSQGGLGIGLSLVRALMELHGGSVEARSEGLGKGSEFILRLPVAEVDLSVQEAGLEADARTFSPSAAKKSILVVDDNKSQATSLAMLLELNGYGAEIVYDATSALKLVAEFTPQVALIDIGLPDMTGYELAQRLRALPQLQGITLIAQTGWGRNEDIERAKQAGFDFHLIKPINHQLLEKILHGGERLPSDTLG